MRDEIGRASRFFGRVVHAFDVPLADRAAIDAALAAAQRAVGDRCWMSPLRQLIAVAAHAEELLSMRKEE